MYEIFYTLVEGALLCSFLSQDTSDPRMWAPFYYQGQDLWVY